MQADADYYTRYARIIILLYSEPELASFVQVVRARSGLRWYLCSRLAGGWSGRVSLFFLQLLAEILPKEGVSKVYIYSENTTNIQTRGKKTSTY